MRRGFTKNGEYTTLYNAIERKTIKRLSEIEQEDADACANCGGEDCICCEIYHDRQKWVSPDELFEEENSFVYWRDEDARHDYYDEEEDWEGDDE